MSATVLLVDDEVRSLDAMRRTLEEDFEVLTAGGTEEARVQLEQREVDVILCDQRMPGATGVEFLREARERWPDSVRIVISGYTDSEDIIAGINDAGIYQYILKPWVPDHLLATVRNALMANKAYTKLESSEHKQMLQELCQRNGLGFQNGSFGGAPGPSSSGSSGMTGFGYFCNRVSGER